jgi:hypothetical protein
VTHTEAYAALAELGRRVEAKRALAAFTPEALTTTPEGVRHVQQFDFVTCAIRWMVLMCSRRAGKTDGIARRWALASMAKPKGIRIYLALTGGQARDIMWEPKWKPLCDAWGLPCEHNETRMITTFENGSRVRLGGTDDIRAIKKELGAGLDEAAVDEAQDQQDSVLADLCGRILPHAMTDKRGTILVSGVVPEVQAGYYWDLWAKSKWAKFNFSQMENPFLPHAMAELLEYLEQHPGLTMDSPVIQRERFGKFKYDKSMTAYTYSPQLNGYHPEAPDWLATVQAWMDDRFPENDVKFLEPTQAPTDGKARFGLMASVPHAGIDRFSMSIDQARGDRVSVNVNGWGNATHEVQHVFEWSTPRNAALTMRQIAPIMSLAETHYDLEHRSMDGVQNELDTFQNDYGVGVVKAPNKQDLPGQVRRSNDLLTKGWAQIMEGSATEEDFQKARWNKDARAKGRYEWASQWHPDPSESWRYSLAGYYAAYEEPEAPKTPEEIDRERAELAQRRRLARKSARVLEEDEEAAFDADWE